jgi:hypothetical protein
LCGSHLPEAYADMNVAQSYPGSIASFESCIRNGMERWFSTGGDGSNTDGRESDIYSGKQFGVSEEHNVGLSGRA